MFTGMIEATARILEKTPAGIVIERPASFDDLKIGSSISVSGACLTVVELTVSAMRFDVVPETWEKTKLGSLQKGDRVNLERAMKSGDRLDGHIVQGHVEGVGEVEIGDWRLEIGGHMTIRLTEKALGRIVPKGSIAVDGVSLTIADINDKTVTIALIPHTLKNTTLGSLKKGDPVNIETDVLMRPPRKKKRNHPLL